MPMPTSNVAMRGRFYYFVYIYAQQSFINFILNPELWNLLLIRIWRTPWRNWTELIWMVAVFDWLKTSVVEVVDDPGPPAAVLDLDLVPAVAPGRVLAPGKFSNFRNIIEKYLICVSVHWWIIWYVRQCTEFCMNDILCVGCGRIIDNLGLILFIYEMWPYRPDIWICLYFGCYVRIKFILGDLTETSHWRTLPAID